MCHDEDGSSFKPGVGQNIALNDLSAANILCFSSCHERHFSTLTYALVSVPRVLFDGWNFADFQTVFSSEDIMEDCINVLVGFIKVRTKLIVAISLFSFRVEVHGLFSSVLVL